MNKLTPELYKKNRAKLSKLLKPNSVAIICSATHSMRTRSLYNEFRQSSNMIYLTGVMQEETVLVLYPNHSKKEFREILFIRYTDNKTLIWEGHKHSKEDATMISGVGNVKWCSELPIFLKKVIESASYIYLEMGDECSVNDAPISASFRFAEEIKSKYPSQRFEKLVPLINQLRLVKETTEIEIIKEAIEITGKTFCEILPLIKPGLYEYDVEAEITMRFIKSEKCPHAYLPIIASGNSSTILHYNFNNAELISGDLLLLDFGAEKSGYASDLSRTIPISGKFTKRQTEVYKSVLSIMKEAKKLMVIGNTIDKLNESVGLMMEEELIKLKLLRKSDICKQNKENSLYKKYYMHGTSHFIGLDVHDCGNREVPFAKGMVLSCEPGIYIKEEGFGIRLENDILIDKTPIDLMEKIPIELEEIEELMRK
ncbi:MAG: aminopeptidase P N-terminal domain-containing protein [Bacteroidia bacterium]|nr:aminopeptidase P N-terminal domain-containing protein [Bacteroidia bacterium]